MPICTMRTVYSQSSNSMSIQTTPTCWQIWISKTTSKNQMCRMRSSSTKTQRFCLWTWMPPTKRTSRVSRRKCLARNSVSISTLVRWKRMSLVGCLRPVCLIKSSFSIIRIIGILIHQWKLIKLRSMRWPKMINQINKTSCKNKSNRIEHWSRQMTWWCANYLTLICLPSNWPKLSFPLKMCKIRPLPQTSPSLWLTSRKWRSK